MKDNIDKNLLKRKMPSKKIAMAAIFIALGVILSYLNPFAYFYIFNTKINPFVHMINSITGVLLGVFFSTITSLGIAIIRFSLSIGTHYGFPGGIPGAVVVGLVSYFIKKKNPKYIIFAALFEPLGTVFIGGTIATLITPFESFIGSLLTFWGLFAASCIPGSIIGFIILGILKNAGITWEDFN